MCLIDCERVVTTSYGKVKDRSNSVTNTWYGIHYAAPAGAGNRWHPLQPWGDILDADVILGVVKDEGSLFEAYRDHPSSSNYKNYLTERYTEMDADDTNNVIALYPVGDFINVGHAVSVISGDRNIICPGVKTSKNLSAAGYPVYQYQFTEYNDSILRKMTSVQLGTNPPPLGVFHSGEVGFLFGTSSPTSELRTETQKAVSKTI